MNHEELNYNDVKSRKKLGAFFTPKPYAEEGFRLLMEQIKTFKINYPTDDYIIIDRCAGTGNLESVMDNETLSHCILNTYKEEEFLVLKQRFENKIRYLFNPSDALTKDFCNSLSNVITTNKTTRHCGIFFLENPPYSEPQAIANQKITSGEGAAWKKSYLVKEMKKEIHGVATNDLANVFIWSSFKFMKDDDDGCVMFAPIKYWKVQHMIDKMFVDGFIGNRKHFNCNSSAAISIISWKNKQSSIDKINLRILDIENNCIKEIKTIECNQIEKQISKSYFDNRKINNIKTTVVCNTDGTEYTGNKSRTIGYSGDNVVGYMMSTSSTLEQPALTNQLLTCASYAGCGFYLRRDNLIEKFPVFAAGYYCTINNDWWNKSLLNKSGDGFNKFKQDINNKTIDDWLIKCMIWSGLTNNNHMRSFTGTDGVNYINELSFLQDSIVDELLKEYKYELNDDEKEMFSIWRNIIEIAKKSDRFNTNYKYNPYQIEQEFNNSEIKELCKSLKQKLKKYYINYISDGLLYYEFIK